MKKIKFILLEGVQILQVIFLIIATSFAERSLASYAVQIVLVVYMFYLIFIDPKRIVKKLDRIYKKQFERELKKELSFEYLRGMKPYIMLGFILLSVWATFPLLSKKYLIFLAAILLILLIESTMDSHGLFMSSTPYKIVRVEIPREVLSIIVNKKFTIIERELSERIKKYPFLSFSVLEKREYPLMEEEIVRLWMVQQFPKLKREVAKLSSKFEGKIKEERKKIKLIQAAKEIS